jgi:aspartate/methionine/tyrosine aminotransferase|tara:strand:- start:2114 stop:3406 length:1293 start_codon:yes stop_codon:yes gene_type:complete
MNTQAEELNKEIMKANPAVMEMLSDKGKNIFFPKKGIVAQGIEAKDSKINASIGIALEEDGSPMRLKSIASNVNLDTKDIFPYAPSFGKPELREAWKKLIYKKNSLLKGKEISLPIVTNALTHGLSMSGYLFAESGDKIIVPEPFWGNYKLIFINGYGAELKTFPLFDNSSFNIKGFEKALSEEGKKKIVLLNFPNNPAGYTPKENEIKQIVDAIKKSAESGNNVIVLIDDAYFGLVFEDGIFKESIFCLLTDIHENVLAVKLDGATKEDYVWGFRTGFITYGIKGSKEAQKGLYTALENKTSGAVRGSISNAPHISQSLVLKAFKAQTYWDEKKEKYDILKRRYTKVKEVLEEHKEYEDVFEALPFNSGYFMCIRLKNNDSEKIRKILLDKYSAGVISMGDLIRVAFSATPTEKIPELFDNIYNACKER